MEDTEQPRERIVRAATELLERGGRDAVTTRAVSAAAGVQAPTIYRQFGDMRGLLDAVASHGFAEYLERKTNRERSADPVEDLKWGWDLHVDFGVRNPAIYTLMYGDPSPGHEPPAATRAAEILHGLVTRVAEAGRLRVSVDRAARMIHAAGSGITLTLIAQKPANRDPGLSQLTRDTVLAAITTPASEGARPASATHHAVALMAALPEIGADLSFGERALLAEWLNRIAES
jgi:AcrR family transcriptional regulator